MRWVSSMAVKYKVKKKPKKKKSIDKSNVFMTKVIDGTYNFLASPWDK
jgi:hypothetical protein